MRLSTRVRAYWLLAALGIAVAAAGAFMSRPWLAMAAVLVWGVAAYALRDLNRTLRAKMLQLCRAGDVAGVHALGDQVLAASWPLRGARRWSIDVLEGAALVFARRFEEAVQVHRRLLVAAPPEHVLQVKNNLAWALARMGQVAEALALSSELVAQAEKEKNPSLANYQGTLGLSLFLAKRPEEARAVLESAMADQGWAAPEEIAARAFYLGEVCSALGDAAAAKAAFARAANEAPDFELGRLARARVEGELSSPRT